MTTAAFLCASLSNDAVAELAPKEKKSAGEVLVCILFNFPPVRAQLEPAAPGCRGQGAAGWPCCALAGAGPAMGFPG